MVEALVCTQTWLKGHQGGLKLDNHLDETHSYEFLEEGTLSKYILFKNISIFMYICSSHKFTLFEVKEKDNATTSAEISIINM